MHFFVLVSVTHLYYILVSVQLHDTLSSCTTVLMGTTIDPWTFLVLGQVTANCFPQQ